MVVLILKTLKVYLIHFKILVRALQKVTNNHIIPTTTTIIIKYNYPIMIHLSSQWFWGITLTLLSGFVIFQL
jgi:hypothetical protein